MKVILRKSVDLALSFQSATSEFGFLGLGLLLLLGGLFLLLLLGLKLLLGLFFRASLPLFSNDKKGCLK
jgi:hypothetical protein